MVSDSFRISAKVVKNRLCGQQLKEISKRYKNRQQFNKHATEFLPFTDVSRDWKRGIYFFFFEFSCARFVLRVPRTICCQAKAAVHSTMLVD